MTETPEPGIETNFHAAHVALMLSSYRHWTGRDLCEISARDPIETALHVYLADFFLSSHTNDEVPVLNYGNLTSQCLFEMDWPEFVGTESRYTAEPSERDERQRLLDTVNRQGYIDDYSGIRVSATGKRFFIKNVKVWNLVDEQGSYQGQAAYFEDWEYLQE